MCVPNRSLALEYPSRRRDKGVCLLESISRVHTNMCAVDDTIRLYQQLSARKLNRCVGEGIAPPPSDSGHYEILSLLGIFHTSLHKNNTSYSVPISPVCLEHLTILLFRNFSNSVTLQVWTASPSFRKTLGIVKSFNLFGHSPSLKLLIHSPTPSGENKNNGQAWVW